MHVYIIEHYYGQGDSELIALPTTNEVKAIAIGVKRANEFGYRCEQSVMPDLPSDPPYDLVRCWEPDPDTGYCVVVKRYEVTS